MRGILLSLCAVVVLAAPGAMSEEANRGVAALSRKWFFCFGYRLTRADVDTVKSLVETAGAHGFNGMVLSSFGLDRVTRWKPEDVALLREVDALCRRKGVELIPAGFSVGYGGALWHDRNFAAALPVSMSVVARSGKIVPAASERNLIVNGDLEEHDERRFAHYVFHDRPGDVTFVDTKATGNGTACIRFENLTATKPGHGRIMQKIELRPGCAYRLSARIKTRDLVPVSGLKLLVLKEKGQLASKPIKIDSTQDWTETTLEFVNFAAAEVRVYAGIWGGKSGTFWLDDFQLREHGSFADIVRRDGTPLTLRSADRDMVFTEGEDFADVVNSRDADHIVLTKASRIRDGENLTLSCYKTPFVGHSWGRQVSMCMSNPALYAHWEEQARKLHELIKFKRFLLAMDEIRNGGGCELCRRSGKSMGEILGDCITKQRGIFKAIDPEIEVLVWSDMLDPNHNAHNDYYGVVGDFAGSWEHVPKDIVMACWYHKIRNESLAFFSKLGFRTLGAGYYDSDDLTGVREWHESLTKTPNAVGIMFTSWRRKYGLLADFGDFVSRQPAAAPGPQEAQ